MSARILIVEDELLIAKTLSRKLEKMGYTVIDMVSSGETAIQLAQEKQPDLILMDIVIEGELDGIETASIIRETMDIPIIYLTAYADDETLQRAESTGAYGYAIKPFQERELHATIKMALNKHKEALKMREALAEIQTVNEDKIRYLSIASHDLRTPLTTIKMSADLLQRYQQKWDDGKKVKHLDRIQNAVDNMNELLEDILTLSQAESGKLNFNPAWIDVIALGQSIMEQFQSTITQKHTLNFYSQVESISAYLDEKLLRHILTNLLSNAIKYSPDGCQIRLEVLAEYQQIIFRIQDEGIGIPIEYQDKLFERFERAGNVGQIKGTGLGLSIVKQAVDLHNGEITVESAVGVGTTFTVILPAKVSRG